MKRSGAVKIRICAAIVVMGFSGLAAEILLLRELLIVFSGNELCIGIILANWLILEAFGCFFSGKICEKSRNKGEAFTVITVLFSFSVPAAIFLIRILKRVLGVSIGESIGFLQVFYSSFLILLPVSILHGALFTFSCRIFSLLSGHDASSAGRVYFFETTGTIIGGIACTYLFIPYLNSFLAASGLALLNFIACLVLLTPYWNTGLFQKLILVILIVLIFSSGFLIFTGKVNKLHQFSIKTQWKHHNIVHYQNSQYGNICIIENQGQYIFFLDGIPSIIIPVPDIPFTSEFVHLPLLAHPEPVHLLIISGGAGGVINEALKHPQVEMIEYAELDPLLLDLLKKFPTPLTESELNDKRVRIKQIDGRLFLKTTKNTYDIIFIGIMEPSNLQSNRFFTKEFFSLVKKRLNKGGILVIGLPGSLTYVNEELKNLNSCIYNTLKSVFTYSRVLPGDGRNLFLSSDSREISTIDRMKIVERLNRRNTNAGKITAEIIPWYIEKKLHHGWQDWFSRFVQGGSRQINSDFNPMGLFYSISYWNALFTPSLRWLFRQFERITIKVIVLLFGFFLLLYFFFRLKNRHLNKNYNRSSTKVVEHLKIVQSGLNFVEEHFKIVQSGLNFVEEHFKIVQSGLNFVEEHFKIVQSGLNFVEEHFKIVQSGLNFVEEGLSRAGIPLCIMTTGFAGMIFDLMFIFTFQSVYGHVFSWIGILVASFMAGAATGAIIITTVLTRIKNCFALFIKIELAILFFSIGWPLIFPGIYPGLDSPGAFFLFRILFLIISFICGLLIGSEFPLANRIYRRKNSSVSKTAGILYACDLLGGWCGGITGAVVLLPVLGLTGTCITVGLLKFTSLIVITTQPKKALLL